MFQRRSAVSVLQLIRKKWGYVLFVVTMIILVTTRIRLTKQPNPFEETPAMTSTSPLYLHILTFLTLHLVTHFHLLYIHTQYHDSVNSNRYGEELLTDI